MRIVVLSTFGHKRAEKVAAGMNAAVSSADGGRQNRFYTVERGRVGCLVVKYTEGREEAESRG